MRLLRWQLMEVTFEQLAFDILQLQKLAVCLAQTKTLKIAHLHLGEKLDMLLRPEVGLHSPGVSSLVSCCFVGAPGVVQL